MQRSTRALVIVLATFCIAASSQAAWYNPLSWFKKDAPHTLIVTGNYVQSRVLAELIQYHTKYPILFLPAARDDDKLYMLHYNGESMAIDVDDYTDFIYTLRPKTVLFLGNENYTPQEYISSLGSDVTVTVVRNNNWYRIATSVGDQLQISKLAKQFEAQMQNFDDSGNIIKEKGVEAAKRKYGAEGSAPAAADAP